MLTEPAAPPPSLASEEIPVKESSGSNGRPPSPVIEIESRALTSIVPGLPEPKFSESI
jgi:hypothetical protein